MISNITGSPVEGSNFFGREKELEYIWKHIQKGNSVILSAPRRVGKSSLAKKIIQQAKDAGWNSMEYDLLLSEKHLNTWEERLNEYKELEDYARKLLKRLSSNKEGESRSILLSFLNTIVNDQEKTDSILSQLIYMLKNDGYLIEEESKYSFRSPLLRDFWYKRFSK
ncbi:hypothetical protein [Flavobacterium sp. XS2P39]|uniref:hypothetical protein n=1 Tax=Flavobacterium sp. XS2P39 TaxID=3401725 RepID=UPI003AAFEA33